LRFVLKERYIRKFLLKELYTGADRQQGKSRAPRKFKFLHQEPYLTGEI
jgi:hypothetical protein